MTYIERIEARLVPIPACGCEVWEGSLDSCGYGTIKVEGLVYKVHRLRWMLVNGAIPDGMNVLHRCDLPCCAAMEHLYLGTQLRNMRDAATRRRMWRKVTIEQELEIIVSTLTQEEIAEQYGISQAQVSRIKSGIRGYHGR